MSKAPHNKSKAATKRVKLWSATSYANLVRYVPSGTYYARFRAAGKLVWKSLDTKRVSVAQLRLADVLKNNRELTARQQETDGGRMTVVAALDAVLQRIEGNPARKPRTKESAADRVKALKKSWPALDSMDVRNVKKDDCLRWAAGLAPDLSASSYNQMLRCLRRAFDLAVERGSRVDNPAKSVEWRREHPKRLKLPEPAEFGQLLESIRKSGAVEAEDSARFVEFLAYTGCRLNEAINIRWMDVDFTRSCLIIRGDPISGTKNNEVRQVPLIGNAAALLRKLRDTRLNEPPTANILRQKTARKALTHACKRLGIRHITHHDLRHLFATRCIESGVDIPTVSRWLGHKDGGALAMRVYGHLRDQHSQAMAQKVVF